MTLLKKLIFIIFVFNYSVTFAADICNMNGDWYDPSGLTGGWYFQQNGTMLIGMMKRQSNCGALVTGTVDVMGVSFTVSTIRKSPECHFSVEVKAKLLSDCRSIEGSWSYIKDGEESGSGTLVFLRNPVEIIEPAETQLVITKKPEMPAFEVKAAVTGALSKLNTGILPYNWGMKFTNTYVPNKIFTLEADDIETDDYIYRPRFNPITVIDHGKDPKPPRPLTGGIGGQVTFSMDYFQNIHVEKQLTILGTNPGQKAIEEMIPDKTLRQIACQESRYKQFDAKREGGIGYPTGTICGVGIMQLCNPVPTPEQAWDWRANVSGGATLYNEKRSTANNWPEKERKNINEKRIAAGLRACQSLPDLTAEQLQRDTIRLYNCGHEYQWEPWNDPDCKGQWVLDPTCKITDPEKYDATYVNKVLACDINQ